MKIKISDTILNPLGESPKNFNVETRRKCQTEFVIDSSLARVFDRGNSMSVVSFEMERSHTSEEEAEAFSLSHAAMIQNLSPLSFSVETDAGANFSLSNAAPTKIKVGCDGIITNTRYEFTGAIILES